MSYPGLHQNPYSDPQYHGLCSIEDRLEHQTMTFRQEVLAPWVRASAQSNPTRGLWMDTVKSFSPAKPFRFEYNAEIVRWSNQLHRVEAAAEGSIEPVCWLNFP